MHLSKRGNKMLSLANSQHKHLINTIRSSKKCLSVSQKGFTLVELMIVVTIIAILASIAIPAYSDYVTRSKIAEGLSGLSDSRVKMEQFFQDNHTYVGAADPINTDHFSYALSSTGISSYVITATGLNEMSAFSYSIDQANTKRTISLKSGWGSAGDCWIAKKGGSC